MTWDEFIHRLQIIFGLHRYFDDQPDTPVGFYYRERFGDEQ